MQYGCIEITYLYCVARSREDCAKRFSLHVTQRIGPPQTGNEQFHFSIDSRPNRASFRLSSNDSNIAYLEDMTPEILKTMIEYLLLFEQTVRVDETPQSNISILTYTKWWKNTQAFHLKIHPRSIEEFRAIIHRYTSDDEVTDILTTGPLTTEFINFKSELEHIRNTISQDDCFHALPYSGLECTLHVSKKTYSIVAVNKIDMKECENPYCDAYKYARALENTFGPAIGSVNFAIDREEMQIWVWAKFDNDQFQEKVLSPWQIPGGDCIMEYEFPHPPPIQKPEGCNGVHVWNLHYDTTEADLRNFFCQFGAIHKVYMKLDDDRKWANVFFKNKDATAAVEKAVQFTIDRDKFLRGRTVKVTYFTRLY